MASSMTDASLDALRSVVQDSLGKHLYQNAIFFADKLVAITHAEDDVYRLVQAYLFTQQHRRALHVLRTMNLATSSTRFRYLTAKCLAECHEWDECLATLDEATLDAVKVGPCLGAWARRAPRGGSAVARAKSSLAQPPPAPPTPAQAEAEAAPSGAGQVSMFAALQLLKGSVYESQENWPLASRCYTSALRVEPLCYEAIDRLVGNHMLSAGAQKDLLLELEPKLASAGAEWLQVYYRCKLDPERGRELAERFHDASTTGTDGGVDGAEDASADAEITSEITSAPSAMVELRDNGDILTAAAEFEYNHDRFRRAYNLSSRVLAKDPFQQHVLPVRPLAPCPTHPGPPTRTHRQPGPAARSPPRASHTSTDTRRAMRTTAKSGAY